MVFNLSGSGLKIHKFESTVAGLPLKFIYVSVVTGTKNSCHQNLKEQRRMIAFNSASRKHMIGRNIEEYQRKPNIRNFSSPQNTMRTTVVNFGKHITFYAIQIGDKTL